MEFRAPRERLVGLGQIEHHRADLTATCAADVSLDALQQTLGQVEQWLPVDGDPRAAIGTLVSTNSTGPLRLGFGGWRDLLLGVQVRLRSGQLITVGARTMKNVAGYDLTKFMVGSYGRFGELETITFRTYRRPTHGLLVEFEPREDLIGQLLPTTARPQWAMIAGGRMFCGYLGDAATIAFYQADLPPHRPLRLAPQSPADDIAFRAQGWLPPRDGLKFRASVPPIKTLAFMQQLHLDNLAADPTFGIVVGACAAEQMQQLRATAQSFHGTVVFDDPADLQSFGGADAATVNLLRRLEAAFQSA
jgi:glycolate oxidase FAD binding subunit